MSHATAEFLNERREEQSAGTIGETCQCSEVRHSSIQVLQAGSCGHEAAVERHKLQASWGSPHQIKNTVMRGCTAAPACRMTRLLTHPAARSKATYIHYSIGYHVFTTSASLWLQLRLARLDAVIIRSLRHGRCGRRPPLITHELKWSWSRLLQHDRRSSMCWLTVMRLKSKRATCSACTKRLGGQSQGVE